MADRFTLVSTQAPVVNFNDPKSWTPKVQSLYERLQSGDAATLADLIAIDLEFLTDPSAIRALVGLKYDPQWPAEAARRELRRIANVIVRRPRLRADGLPGGDVLLGQIKECQRWIEDHGLLQYKKALNLDEIIDNLLRPTRKKESRLHSRGAEIIDDDGTVHPVEIRARPQQGLAPPQRHITRKALLAGVTTSSGGFVRTSRSWALGAVAEFYKVERKAVEKRIDRDPLARAWRAGQKD